MVVPHPQRYRRYGDAMDEYLGKLELIRRPMPKDDTSIFRAVSEQMYLTQRFHKEIRQVCKRYINDNRAIFDRLPVTHAFIIAISTLFKRDIVIYRELGKAPYNANGNRYPQKVFLCESFGGHFDSVYHKTTQDKMGMCQSIVYEVLYCAVMGMDRSDVDNALLQIRSERVAAARASMRRASPATAVYPYSYGGGRRQGGGGFARESGERRFSDSGCHDYGASTAVDEPESSEFESSNEHHSAASAGSIAQGYIGDAVFRPPFPYKVAKALDPSLYRNVEYDAWLEEKKEFYLQERRRNSQVPFPPGRECLVKFDPSFLYYGIVQQILPDMERAIVFIKESGEMREVPISCLSSVPPGQRLKGGGTAPGDDDTAANSAAGGDGSVTASGGTPRGRTLSYNAGDTARRRNSPFSAAAHFGARHRRSSRVAASPRRRLFDRHRKVSEPPAGAMSAAYDGTHNRGNDDTAVYAQQQRMMMLNRFTDSGYGESSVPSHNRTAVFNKNGVPMMDHLQQQRMMPPAGVDPSSSSCPVYLSAHEAMLAAATSTPMQPPPRPPTADPAFYYYYPTNAAYQQVYQQQQSSSPPLAYPSVVPPSSYQERGVTAHQSSMSVGGQCQNAGARVVSELQLASSCPQHHQYPPVYAHQQLMQPQQQPIQGNDYSWMDGELPLLFGYGAGSSPESTPGYGELMSSGETDASNTNGFTNLPSSPTIMKPDLSTTSGGQPPPPARQTSDRVQSLIIPIPPRTPPTGRGPGAARKQQQPSSEQRDVARRAVGGREERDERRMTAAQMQPVQTNPQMGGTNAEAGNALLMMSAAQQQQITPPPPMPPAFNMAPTAAYRYLTPHSNQFETAYHSMPALALQAGGGGAVRPQEPAIQQQQQAPSKATPHQQGWFDNGAQQLGPPPPQQQHHAFWQQQQAQAHTVFYPAVAGAMPCVDATQQQQAPFNQQMMLEQQQQISPTSLMVIPPMIGGTVNFEAMASRDLYGTDLPKDLATLRFFYNLGCEYFRHMEQTFGRGNVYQNIIPTPPSFMQQQYSQNSGGSGLLSGVPFEPTLIEATPSTSVANTYYPPEASEIHQRYEASVE